MGTLAVGATVGEKYRLDREIARGGMGSVWLARHLQLDAPVAIKFMDEGLVASDAARERFVREAKAAAQIQSPHVVHISDYGVDDGSPYIVMELLEGEDLDTRLLRGPMSLHETEQLVLQAAKGLRKAHDAGIVHRDLKPSNLFLAGDDEEWTVKIVDFGVAKAAGAGPIPLVPTAASSRPGFSSEVTHTGMVLGSPQYMSPEQARGFKEVDHTADVWALASIAFRAVTGRRLFEGLDAMQVLTTLVYEPLPIPSAIAPDLPLPLQHFFDRALSREPSQRFTHARPLADAFSKAVAEVLRQQDATSIAGATVPAHPGGAPSSLRTPPFGTLASEASQSGPHSFPSSRSSQSGASSSLRTPAFPELANHPSLSQAFVPPPNPALPKITLAVVGATLGLMMVAGLLASTREPPLSISAGSGLVPREAPGVIDDAAKAARSLELAERRRLGEIDDAIPEVPTEAASEVEPRPVRKGPLPAANPRPHRSWGF
jgi:eukaryotic-like serine/threonine-protein kinase